MDGLASDAVNEVVIAIGERPGVSQGQRHFVEHTLPQAQELWRKTRDLECGFLARFDISLDGDVYEQRLRCLIRADRERITVLKHRYEKDTGRGP